MTFVGRLCKARTLRHVSCSDGPVALMLDRRTEDRQKVVH